MFCQRFGTGILEDSQFCRKWGHAAFTSSGAAAAVAPAPVAAKPKSRIAIWVLLPFLIVVVCLWVAKGHSPGARQLQQPTKQRHTETISNPALPVKPTGNAYFKFDVPPGAANVNLQGSFIASGGGDDIEAHIFSESDFMNWLNSRSAETYYSSGRVTAGKFHLNLPSDSGTYFLVFDNTFSLLTQKTVRVNATLTYYQ
jgi:hypothetical protein